MAEEKKNRNPIEEHLYEERKDFCIVALTGVLGSGFDNLTKIMTSKKSLLDSVRAPQNIHVPYCSLTEVDHSEENKKDLSKLLFHRKYTICYNYIKDNYAEYTILKYNKVLWYYTLRYFAQQVSERLQLGYGENGTDPRKAPNNEILDRFNVQWATEIANLIERLVLTGGVI